MAEDAVVQPQPVFLEAHELREGEAECRVVAQRAEVSQVIRHTLALEHEGAQPSRARGRCESEQRLRRLRVRPRVGDR